MNTLSRFAFAFVLILVLGTTLVTAQEDTAVSLRTLAETRGLAVGAAAYSYHLDDPALARVLSREFNMLTPEHEAKHCQLESQPGRFDFRRVDRLVDFAEANNMTVHGHALVWHSCMPTWLQPGAYTRDEAIAMLRTYIMTVVGRYKGRIPIWDVVNEAVADSGVGLRDTPWLSLIGDDYVELAFRFAHEADPEALLFYNDYGAEGLNAKSDAIYAMAADFVARGVPIHGIGLQSHFVLYGVGAEAMAANIQRIGELGLEVQITELDVRFNGKPSDIVLRQQASDYRAVMDVCLASDYCTAFIVWGVSDAFTWLRGENLGFYYNTEVAPLLFDDLYEPKPAYFALIDALASAESP